MKRPPEQTANIGREIGLFFLSQNNEDYQKTRKFLQKLCITDIREENGKLVIETARPGLLIGRKGINYDGLMKHLERKIEIVESFSWADWMTPIDVQEFFDEDEAYNSFSDWLSAEAYANSDYIEDELDGSK